MVMHTSTQEAVKRILSLKVFLAIQEDPVCVFMHARARCWAAAATAVPSQP